MSNLGFTASLMSRRQLSCLFCTLGVFSFLFSTGGAAVAADKSYVDIVCGGTKASIMCKKYKDNLCVDSELTFDTSEGHHIVSAYVPPQNFIEPTIADGLQCETSSHDGAHHFVVWYTPGCRYAACYTIKLFDIRGDLLSRRQEKDVDKYPAVDEPKQPVTLRGDAQ